MASGGNLIIHMEDDEQLSKNKTECQQSLLTGKDAAVAFHFCQEILTDLAVKFEAAVVRIPCKGLIKDLEIKYKEEYTKEVEKAIEIIRHKKKSLLMRDILVPRENISQLIQFLDLQESRPSSCLFLADVAVNKVSILAKSNEEADAAEEELKKFIGIKKSATLAGTETKTYASIRKANTTMSNDVHFHDDTSLKVFSDINIVRAIYKKEINNDADKKKARPVSDNVWLVETLRNGFVFKVYKASILNVNVEVIVNAANESLMHGGGVAYVIAGAAGYEMQKEGDEYIHKYGDLHVSENYVTTAGKLNYKGVIHAIGPVWHNYKDKVTCLEKLCECIMHIFHTCNKKKFSSVGMPAISAGIFGVPKELCADMYVKAAVDYSEVFGTMSVRYPNEFHFVDLDMEILELVKISYKKWKQDPSLIEPRNCVELYFKSQNQLFMLPSHQDKQITRTNNEGFNKNVQSHIGHSVSSFTRPLSDDGSSSECNIKCDLKTMDRQKLGMNIDIHVFKIASKIVLKLVSSSIKQLTDLDAVVCGIDKTLQPHGFICDAIRQAGGKEHANSFQDMVKFNQSKVYLHHVVKCSGGNLGAKNVIFLVMDKLMNADKRETKLYQQGIVKVLEKANEWKFRKLALPLIGTGKLQINKERLQYCVEALLKGICEFCCKIAKSDLIIEEIHLVNNNDMVSRVHEEVFYRVASHQTNDRVAVSDNRSSSQRGSSTGFESGCKSKLSSTVKENDDFRADTGHEICVPGHRIRKSSSQKGSSIVKICNIDPNYGRSQFGDHMTYKSDTSVATEVHEEQERDKTRASKPAPTQHGNLSIFECN